MSVDACSLVGMAEVDGMAGIVGMGTVKNGPLESQKIVLRMMEVWMYESCTHLNPPSRHPHQRLLYLGSPGFQEL